jgi:hypothetical protein
MSVFARFQKPTVPWDYPLQVIALISLFVPHCRAPKDSASQIHREETL